MALVKIKCPNCGGSISTANRRVLFCEYCGSKLSKSVPNKKTKKSDIAAEDKQKLYNQVLFELKFEKYRELNETLFKALRQDHENSNLLLINSVLNKDIYELNRVVPSQLSNKVVELCMREIKKWDVVLDYTIDYKELKKYGIGNIKNIKTTKIDLFENTSSDIYLSFLKILVNEKDYKDVLDNLETINEQKFREYNTKIEKWKRVYKRRFWISMFFFSIFIYFILFNIDNYLLELLYGYSSLFTGITLFVIRKNYKPKF